MPAPFLCKTLTGCVFVALWTTALLADPPAELSSGMTDTAASAVDTKIAAPAEPPQLDPPRPENDVPTFQPIRTDSGDGGVVFRPPKRPSQVKQLPLGHAEMAETSDAQSVESTPDGTEPAEETAPLAKPEDDEQDAAPRTLPLAAEDSADPPNPADEPQVGTMSFNGVEPGETTLAALKQQWGEPATQSAEGGMALYTFVMEPFKQVDVTAQDNLVTSVVVYLDPPMFPAVVANELRLREFVPVPIPDANGQLLGQVYPERGVLFGFAANDGASRVAQIVVEPISAEPFVLRALYDFNHRYSANLEDLDFALSRDENDAQAHWVKSRVLTHIGRYEDALTEARAAVRLDPAIPTYRLQLAHTFGLQGRYDEAVELVEAVRTEKDVAACVKARAECELGRLSANRPDPDHKTAVDHYQAAIELASPLVGDKRFEIRRAAKQVLVDANAGIGLSVALGNYQRKFEVSKKWFDRAGAYSDQYVGGDNGPKYLPLVILSDRLAAYAGMQDQADPSETADAAIQAGRNLIAWSDDPLFEQQVEWLLGSALMDAVRVEHGRGEHLQALRYAEMALPMIESALAERQLAPAEQFALGRFYFLAGAVEAVKKQDHVEAAAWYSKALPYLTSPAAQPHGGLATGRLGEWFVSMGVTLWEVGDKPKAVELTERGAELVQQAVDQGIMKKSAVSVPYSNLATMHEALGNQDKASSFGQLAKAAETAAADIKRR